MLSSVEILILSAIQGISEFLPVSSVAHLVFISKYYSFTNQNLLIDICLHLGSLIAIVFYFRSDLFQIIKNKTFLIKIIIGTIPIIPIGYILYQTGLINELRNLEGRLLISKLSEFQRTPQAIPKSYIGYDENWKTNFYGSSK